MKWQITDSAVAEEHAVKAADIAQGAGLGKGKMHVMSEKGDAGRCPGQGGRGTRRRPDRGRVEGHELGQPLSAGQCAEQGVATTPAATS